MLFLAHGNIILVMFLNPETVQEAGCLALIYTPFFKNQNLLFEKILSGIPSECQTAWIQIRVQTVCKGYQQTVLQ